MNFFIKNNIWITEWPGFEYKSAFTLVTPLNAVFMELIKQFFDGKKTLIVWKHGILNKDAGCDILLTYSSNHLRLITRILNPERQLPLSNTFQRETSRQPAFLKFIHMEYKINLLACLQRNGIAYQVKT